MSGTEKISTITIEVRDENEALRWFTVKLGFEKRLDLPVIRSEAACAHTSRQVRKSFNIRHFRPLFGGVAGSRGETLVPWTEEHS